MMSNDEERISKAIDDISTSLATTMSSLGSQLCAKYQLSGPQLNIAIARASVAVAATSAAAAFELPFETSCNLCGKIDDLIEQTIEESREQS
jgi:hypothetical protein